jgi:hypothetical protein
MHREWPHSPFSNRRFLLSFQGRCQEGFFGSSRVRPELRALLEKYNDSRVWFKCQEGSEGFNYKFFAESLDAEFVIVRRAHPHSRSQEATGLCSWCITRQVCVYTCERASECVCMCVNELGQGYDRNATRLMIIPTFLAHNRSCHCITTSCEGASRTRTLESSVF